MKKLILVMVSSILFALPAAADWKKEMIDHFFTRAEQALRGRDSFRARFEIALGFHIATMGMCSNFAKDAKIPIPEEVVKLSAGIHATLLRGQVPPQRALRQLSSECLVYIEDLLIREGLSQQDIEEFASEMKQVLSEMEKSFSRQLGLQ